MKKILIISFLIFNLQSFSQDYKGLTFKLKDFNKKTLSHFFKNNYIPLNYYSWEDSANLFNPIKYELSIDEINDAEIYEFEMKMKQYNGSKNYYRPINGYSYISNQSFLENHHFLVIDIDIIKKNDDDELLHFKLKDISSNQIIFFICNKWDFPFIII